MPDGGAFARSREYFGKTEQWLASGEAAGLRHADLEEQLQERGREMLRRMFQDHLGLRGAREERRDDVTARTGSRDARGKGSRPGAGDGVRAGHGDPDGLPCAGCPDIHPLDAELNLPREKQSHGLRKLAAIESARGSHEDAAAAVTRATGVKIGKRQVEELAVRTARDVDGFYGTAAGPRSR